LPLSRIYYPSKQFSIGLWEITESLSDLQSAFDTQLFANSIPNNLHDNRKKELLAVRCLLYKMLKSPYTISYDEYGKPMLFINKQTFPISITHSKNQVAVAIHQTLNIGLDLEHRQERLAKLQLKFLNEKELDFCKKELWKITLCWSAKETVYKWYGKKQVDFKKDIHISPFIILPKGSFKTQLILNNQVSPLQVHYVIINDFAMTWTVS